MFYFKDCVYIFVQICFKKVMTQIINPLESFRYESGDEPTFRDVISIILHRVFRWKEVCVGGGQTNLEAESSELFLTAQR